jgi:hypothetical protein
VECADASTNAALPGIMRPRTRQPSPRLDRDLVPRSRRACEHAFVSIKGSPHARFRRSLETGRLSVVLLAAAELQHLELDDALEVLVLMARERHPRFDRAATRWIGRLLAERPLGLADARFALVLVERLPAGHETLQRFARRR